MSNQTTPAAPKQKMVKRFSKPFIIAHWLNVAAFFTLYISALPMYTEFFDWIYLIFGGPENCRLIHRIAAVAFTLPAIFLIIADPKSFFFWIKQMFTWKKHDFQFFPKFALEFLGKHVDDMPKQDFFNAGEKINSILQVVTTILIIGSGIIMWFANSFPREVVQWAYPIHNTAMALAIAVVVGHIYLATALSKPSMQGMITGEVVEEYARDHHGRWYDELKAEEAKQAQQNKKA